MSKIPAFIKDPKSKRSYTHFDYRVSFESVADRVMDPSFVERYPFYPLIEKRLRRMKPDGEGGFHDEPRSVRYAAHMDRCIYQYYAGLLNCKYNKLAQGLGIDEVAIAYRSNKRGKSNCDFALRAFTAMRRLGSCYVFTGDFHNFFETLDHRRLKSCVKLLFEDGHIPDDYYHVLKNAMHYSVWPIETLLDHHGFHRSYYGVKKLNHLARVLEPKEFKALVRDSVGQPWRDTGAGVPQGLPISGVLANIYMIEFDKALNDSVTQMGGVYMRYSDDFIIIVPTTCDWQELVALVTSSVDAISPVTLQDKKTKVFCCNEGRVEQLPLSAVTMEGRLSHHIDYLGFSFDGVYVRLRQRTIGRYYRCMYRRIKGLYREGKRPSRKRVQSLYLEFSDWGEDPTRNTRVRKKLGKMGSHGNFLTYVKRARRVFPDDPISDDTKRHKQKIRKRANAVLEEQKVLRSRGR